jgi:N-glycosidase YbiA
MRFRGDYAFLSNFFPAQIEYERQWFPTSEHAYQAAKTMDGNERLRIAQLPTPGEAKRAGRYLRLRRDWESIKLDVMEEILRVKFKIPHLRKLLVETVDTLLVEDNTWGDTFWGKYDGVGENHLGLLLMQIRREIATKEE